MSQLTHKDLHWFRLANSNPPFGFYPFKDRFLRRFATSDGFDLQEIEKECWSCNGSGRYFCAVRGWDVCNKCGGDGVYSRQNHWLKRFNLCGSIYHKPVYECDARHENGGFTPDPVEIIEGRIKHEPVDSLTARRAFRSLLIRYEPATYYNLACDDLKNRLIQFRAKLVWRLIRLRNKLDLFPAIEDSDVPF